VLSKNHNNGQTWVLGILAATLIATGTAGCGGSSASGALHAAYVTNSSSNNVSIIDTATNTVVGSVTVGTSPFGVAITPDGSHAYVANVGSNTVSVIATATNTVVATVPVGTQPELVAIAPDGSHAYVTNLQSNNVSVIATATNSVVGTVPVGIEPMGVAVQQ